MLFVRVTRPRRRAPLNPGVLFRVATKVEPEGVRGGGATCAEGKRELCGQCSRVSPVQLSGKPLPHAGRVSAPRRHPRAPRHMWVLLSRCRRDLASLATPPHPHPPLTDSLPSWIYAGHKNKSSPGAFRVLGLNGMKWCQVRRS